MKPIGLSSTKGFTLVEFLAATAILSIGLLALINMQVTAIRGNQENKEAGRAIMLAEEKIEELKGMPFSSLNLGSYQDPQNPLNGSGQSGGIFHRSWNIQAFEGSSLMKAVTVSVSWTLKGKTRSVVNSTVVSR